MEFLKEKLIEIDKKEDNEFFYQKFSFYQKIFFIFERELNLIEDKSHFVLPFYLTVEWIKENLFELLLKKKKTPLEQGELQAYQEITSFLKKKALFYGITLFGFKAPKWEFQIDFKDQKNLFNFLI